MPADWVPPTIRGHPIMSREEYDAWVARRREIPGADERVDPPAASWWQPGVLTVSYGDLEAQMLDQQRRDILALDAEIHALARTRRQRRLRRVLPRLWAVWGVANAVLATVQLLVFHALVSMGISVVAVLASLAALGWFWLGGGAGDAR